SSFASSEAACFGRKPIINNGDRGPPPSRKVYIQRDYSQGLGLRYSTAMPPQLQDRMPEDLFEAAIVNINQILAGAENGSVGVYAESCFACLTGYLIYMCMDTHYERSLKEVRKLIEEYNRTVFMPAG
uniref:Ras modification protein ERF4 n=1 Tax=Macrostomum lignano TaxID=282301 RepID=A0A1I8F8D1_9PLAT